jgi:glycosyltransferase involved in cell wall biosynthesis
MPNIDSNKKPRYSVIVPVYNVANYLLKCLKSILAQKYSDFEIIIIDDGSTDSSPIICDEFQKKFPKIVHVYHKKNEGLGFARNSGINFASGEYLLFVDSDDFLITDDVFSLLDDSVKERHPDCICIKYCIYNERKDLFYDELLPVNSPSANFDTLIRKRYFSFSAWSKVIKKSFLIANNLFFEKGFSEDIVWSGKILSSNPILDFCLLKNIYAYRKERKGSITSQNYNKSAKDWVRILYSCFSLLESNPTKWLRFYCSSVYFHIFMALSKTNGYEREIIVCLKKCKKMLKYPFNFKSLTLKLLISFIGVQNSFLIVSAKKLEIQKLKKT